MDLHISLIGRSDLRGEIYRQLRRAIIEGRLESGALLPPSRELARQLGVSRTTVTVAYDRLTSEGYVSARTGAGTFVSFDGRPAEDGKKRRRPAGVLKPRPIWDSIRLPATFDNPSRFYFRTGIPDASLFPQPTWRRLVARELRSYGNRAGGYGQPAGHEGLRKAISRHIAVSRGLTTSPDDVTITNGTQQALDIMARVMLAPGEAIAVEDPGYQPPNRLFRSLGARVVGVPVDREGMVVDALPGHIRLVYVTPSHQYPLGVTMSMPRRQALLAWAERRNAAIIEDDYDSEFRFGGRPVDPLHTLDNVGRVVYIGSFSKTMLPGLRLGFMVAPPSLREAVQKAKSVTDWHTGTLVQGALARFIDQGEFARHIRRVSAVYGARHQRILNILVRNFADHLAVVPSTTGLHVTGEALHASVEKINGVVRRALEKDVDVHPLSQFAIDVPPRAGIVLGYGAIHTDDIEEGLLRLRRCFDT